MHTETRTDEDFGNLNSLFDTVEDESLDSEEKEEQSSYFETKIKPALTPSILKIFVHSIFILIFSATVYYVGSMKFSIIERFTWQLAGFFLSGKETNQKLLKALLIFVSIFIPAVVFGKHWKKNLQIGFYLSMTSYFIHNSGIKIINHYPCWLERAIPYQNIVSVNIRRMPLRLFHTGDVIITLSDRSKVFFHSIKDPGIIASTILKSVEKQRTICQSS